MGVYSPFPCNLTNLKWWCTGWMINLVCRHMGRPSHLQRTMFVIVLLFNNFNIYFMIILHLMLASFCRHFSFCPRWPLMEHFPFTNLHAIVHVSYREFFIMFTLNRMGIWKQQSSVCWTLLCCGFILSLCWYMWFIFLVRQGYWGQLHVWLPQCQITHYSLETSDDIIHVDMNQYWLK